MSKYSELKLRMAGHIERSDTQCVFSREEILMVIAEIDQTSRHCEIIGNLLERVVVERDQLKADNRLLRHQLAASALELRKASSWICREVEAGTASATHWAIRLRTNAEQIDAAIGKDSRHD